MTAIYAHFCFALVACFVGAIPFGAINLSVINITIKKSDKKGMQFALGSSLVEILEAFLAIVFGLAIERFLREHTMVQVMIVIGFIGVGSYFFFRESHPKIEKKSKYKTSEFWQGVLVALLNPQAVPFWLFALAFAAPYQWLDFVGANLYVFLLGVFLGKLLALFLFVRSSSYVKKHLEESSHWVDRSLGIIFIIIGLIQTAKFYML
jgi:threonine/homoserine/homoserine lactone efflux protein